MRIATSILAIVDPRAREFEPIRNPKWVAFGLLTWSIAALLAAACVWTLRAAELPALGNNPHLLSEASVRTLAGIGVVCVLASGVGAISLVRPTKRMSPMGSRLALLGVVLYVPLAATFWILHGQLDVSLASPYFARLPDAERVLVRAVELLLIAGIMLSLRTNARTLAARSAILRTGRVDRQTMYAVAVTAGLGVLGDLIRLWATESNGAVGQVLSIAGTTLVVIASALLTMGMAGAAIDCARIARALLRSGRRITSLVSMVDVAKAERQPDPAP